MSFFRKLHNEVVPEKLASWRLRALPYLLFTIGKVVQNLSASYYPPTNVSGIWLLVTFCTKFPVAKSKGSAGNGSRLRSRVCKSNITPNDREFIFI